MNRRAFLASLGVGAAALATRSYFDMGAAWQRHASGLLVRDPEVGIAIRFIKYFDIEEAKFVSRIDAHYPRLVIPSAGVFESLVLRGVAVDGR